jgi:hypothetical protein
MVNRNCCLNLFFLKASLAQRGFIESPSPDVLPVPGTVETGGPWISPSIIGALFLFAMFIAIRTGWYFFHTSGMDTVSIKPGHCYPLLSFLTELQELHQLQELQKPCNSLKR